MTIKGHALLLAVSLLAFRGAASAQNALNGIPIGLSNLIPRKQRGWDLGVLRPICDKVVVDSGHAEMRTLLLYRSQCWRRSLRFVMGVPNLNRNGDDSGEKG